MLAPCHASPAHTFRAAARVAPATSADASCMPANTGLSSATVYQDKAAGGQARSSASPAAIPARAAIFGRVHGSYAGSVASISARGPVSPAIFVRMMPQTYPDLATAARQSRPGSGLRDLPPAQTAVAAAIQQQFLMRGRDPLPGPGNPTARPRDRMTIRRGINGHEYGQSQVPALWAFSAAFPGTERDASCRCSLLRAESSRYGLTGLEVAAGRGARLRRARPGRR